MNSNNRYKQDIDLDMSLFATISGIKGNQFGNDVYSTSIKFKDLQEFLEVFPSVQRDISRTRVLSIKRYILSWLEDREIMRFFSAVTVTCRGRILYDESVHRLAIDTRSKMSINDGQHRFQAIKEAIHQLAGELSKNSRDAELKAYYEEKISILENMTIPVIIFDGIEEYQEKQLFHDLNSLARRPSGSANIRLSQSDLYARMARELTAENRYLQHYGVETDKMSIHKKNENTFLLTTIHGSLQTLLANKVNYRKYVDVLTKDNYEEKKAYANSILDKIFFVLPSDINVKGKYVVQNNYALRGIMKFINHTLDYLKIDESIVFEAIKNTDFSNDIEEWRDYNASEGRNGNNVVFNATSTGISSVYKKILSSVDEKLLVEEDNEPNLFDNVDKE